jgi:hypothetical protein
MTGVPVAARTTAMAITATTRRPLLGDPDMLITCLNSKRAAERPYMITVHEGAVAL